MALKLGASGVEVTSLQRWLNLFGADLKPDGEFGLKTEAAIVQLQRNNKLIVDGCISAATHAVLTKGVLPSNLLRADQFVSAAERLKAPLAALYAVLSVESSGSGFLPNDARPVILFERHVLFNRLQKIGIDTSAHVNAYPRLVNPQRGGYVGGAAEWHRLHLAQELFPEHSDCALEACSWGLFQLMGYHWQALRFDNIQQFVGAMFESEAAQLDAFVRFIENDAALLKALRACKWSEFAKRYNGPSFAENHYDTRLAAATQHFERVNA